MSANRAAKNYSNLLAPTVFAAAFALGVAAPADAVAQTEADAGSVGGEDIGISTPDTWNSEPEVAVNLLAAFLATAELRHLGGKGGTAAYLKGGEGAIYVAWVKASKQADDPGKEARGLLDRLKAEPKNSTSDKTSIEEVRYTEEKLGEAIDAQFIWRHETNETVTVSRALVWLNPDKLLRAVRAECVFNKDVAKELTKKCGSALSSLTVDDVEKGTALPLGKVAAPSGAAQPAAEVPAGTPEPGPSMTPADPKSVVLFADEQKKKGGGKKIWIFILGAILVIFAFWSIAQRRRGGDDPKPADDSEKPSGQGEEEE